MGTGTAVNEILKAANYHLNKKDAEEIEYMIKEQVRAEKDYMMYLAMAMELRNRIQEQMGFNSLEYYSFLHNVL